MSSKNIGITLLSIVLAGALGFFIGSRQKPKAPPLVDLHSERALDEHDHPPADHALPPAEQAAAPAHSEWANKSNDELTMSLSKIMLPEDEYTKLGDAIYQTALNLLQSQAQASGVEVSEAVQQELKDTISKKYSRQYFADINADSMKELSKPELVEILSFYGTPAGQKFMTLSPKIIEATMAAVQSDLSQWLPSTVDALLAKLKGTQAPRPKSSALPKASESDFKDKAELKS